MTSQEIVNRLSEKKLKVTPQRIAIYGAIFSLNNHPTTEQIVEFVRKNHPNISVATVYKVLDTLVEHHLIMRVKTDRDIQRYDAVTEHHHHIYCLDSDNIEDYIDHELNTLLEDYFRKKKIPDLKIEDLKLQITGKYMK